MPVHVEVGEKAKIRNGASKEVKKLAELGADLGKKYAQLWAKGTIVSDSTMRIDNQGVTTKPFAGQNIQAQVGTASIAAVILDDALSSSKMSEECQRVIGNAIGQALLDSTRDEEKRWRYVRGTCP
ncbi:hypothetical protein LVX13_28250 [Streptomyces albulus]|uniref:hypothetical protein n=1 Tax=Streptomyces noursei TaxID=1971 RepID=UPI001F2462B1|nr:hypothetical protein [Streptomyces noursei]MCE4946971.1 hypothetical protein [Streptomyces noursei]